MVHIYDTKWATYLPDGSTRDLSWDEKRDPNVFVMPRYWVHESEVAKKLGDWNEPWLLGWRDVSNATNERTFIASQLPSTGIGNTIVLALSRTGRSYLQVIFSSFAFDFVARQKAGGRHMNYFIVQQLPVPTRPAFIGYHSKIEDYVDRLNAQSLDEQTAALLQAELDAIAFKIYGIDRNDMDYIMESFSIVKAKDVKKFGSYRTKELILTAYDQMGDLP